MRTEIRQQITEAIAHRLPNAENRLENSDHDRKKQQGTPHTMQEHPVNLQACSRRQGSLVTRIGAHLRCPLTSACSIADHWQLKRNDVGVFRKKQVDGLEALP